MRPFGILAYTFLALSLTAATARAQSSCEYELGSEEAEALVDDCLEVSPATRPPCNAENPCDLIIEETVRGCEMLKEDAPEFCEYYVDQQ